MSRRIQYRVPQPGQLAPMWQVRAWLHERLGQGAHCPVCDQYAKVYRRQIHATMAKGLIAVYRANGHNQYVHVATVAGPACEVGKLRYWGLIVEEKTRRADGGRSGWWHLTARGLLFVQGQTTVPRYALVYNGRCLGLEGPSISIHDALGMRFSYKELMTPKRGRKTAAKKVPIT